MGYLAWNLCIWVVLDDGHGLALERRVEALFHLAVEAVLVGDLGFRERDRKKTKSQ
jgi:hypothetical protein